MIPDKGWRNDSVLMSPLGSAGIIAHTERQTSQNQWWSKRAAPQNPQHASFQWLDFRTMLVRRVYLLIPTSPLRKMPSLL